MKNLINLTKSKKKIFISIALHPGKVGMKFYNPIFKKMKLNMLYYAIKPNSLNEIFKIIRKKNIKGCSVSMPFKNKVYRYLDYLDGISKDTKILNTIINKRGKLYGYNCDYLAIKKVFLKYKINRNKRILVYGSGSITRILVYYFKINNFKNFNIEARNKNKIKKILGKRKLIKFSNNNYDVLVNTSSLGMKDHPQKIMFKKDQIKNADLIIDFVNKPRSTKLIKYARSIKKKYCDGIEISSYQLSNQFKLYTGLILPKKYLLK